MKSRAVAIVLACALAGVWIASACLVDRRSDALACSQPSDCTAPRVCEGGYCVIDPNACPAECTSCDMTITPHICKIVGSGGSNFTCPPGLNCQFTCAAQGACGNISCSTGSTCTINCTSPSGCGDINCSGRCIIDCATTGACGRVSCASACACDVTCPAGDCGPISCPRGMGNKFCTATGSDGEPCISSAVQCDKC